MYLVGYGWRSVFCFPQSSASSENTLLLFCNSSLCVSTELSTYKDINKKCKGTYVVWLTVVSSLAPTLPVSVVGSGLLICLCLLIYLLWRKTLAHELPSSKPGDPRQQRLVQGREHSLTTRARPPFSRAAWGHAPRKSTGHCVCRRGVELGLETPKGSVRA